MTHNVYGVTGWKNAGKTMMMVGLVRRFSTLGLRVATIKHAHHGFDIDHAGKDSFRHREAGASQIVVASALRIAVIRERPEPSPPTLEELLHLLDAPDLVLVEGYKRDRHPKIAVHRAALGGSDELIDDVTIRAFASDAAIETNGRPIFALDDYARIADFILRDLGMASRLN